MNNYKNNNKYKDYWEKYFQYNFVFDQRRNIVWKEVCRYIQKKYIPVDSKIMDLGAGYCDFINNIDATEKHALDIWRKFANYANEDVVVHIHSCTNLDLFADDFFDVVFASNLLEHLNRDDLTQTLSGLKRIIKHKGILILLQPNFRYCYRIYFDDYTHLQIFTDRGLSELLEAYGFEIVDVKSRFLPVNMKSTLRITPPRLDLIVRLYLRLPYKPFAGQMLMVAQNRP